MLNLTKKTSVRSVHVCVLHCAQLLHTILHKTELIIFPLTLQTIVFAPMMSISGQRIMGLMLCCFSSLEYLIYSKTLP